MLSTAVVEYHNNLASTGVNNTETALTPSTVTVNQFRKQFATPVDGQVYAQPLYMPGVAISGGAQSGTHNVAYVATEHNSVYAIDANGGNVLWQTSLNDTASPLVNLIGASSIAPTTAGLDSDTQVFDTYPEVGITSTPVIDPSAGVLYTVAKTRQTILGDPNIHYLQTLFQIDIHNGAVLASAIIGQTTFAGGVYAYAQNDPYVLGTGAGAISVAGQSRVYFNALREFNRAGLSLSNGNLYIAFASHGDVGPYHGWVLRYSATTLALTGAINVTPNGSGGGIWMGGGIPAVSAAGNVYVITGNGTFDAYPTLDATGHVNGTTGLDANGFPVNSNYGDSLLRLSDDPAHASPANQNTNGWGMKITDYFSPFNNHDLDRRDADFGAGGLVLLPSSVGSAAHPNLLVAAGKDGTIYLVDRQNMGKFDAMTDHIVQEWGKTTTTGINGALNTPAFFNNTIYYFPSYGGDGRAYSISNGAMSSAYTSHSSDFQGQMTGTVSVSANGATNGIAWVLDRNSGALKAYRADDLGVRLWTSNDEPLGRDTIPGVITKFATPTIADGQVFVGSSGTDASGYLVAFGPPAVPTSGPAAPSDLSATAVSFDQVHLSWTDNSSNEDYFEVERSDDDGVTWMVVDDQSVNVTEGDDQTTLATTAYLYRVRAQNSFNGGTWSAYSNVATVTTPHAPQFGTGDGARAEYYNDTNGGGVVLAGDPVLTRVDPTINFDWGSSNPTSPGPGVYDNVYSVRWTGKIQAQFSETYTIAVNADDGVRLWVNGVLLIDRWYLHDPAPDGGVITLSAGQRYNFELDHFQDWEHATVQLLWTSPSTPWQTIPQSQLYSGAAPIAPTNLTAAAISGTNVSLNWQDNSANEGGFALERKAGINGTYQVVAQFDPNVHAYVDSELSPDVDYYYRVRATNFQENSDYSNEAHVLTPVPPLTPSGAKATNVTKTGLHLSWQDNAGNEDGYRILREAPGLTPIVIASSLPPNTTSYNDLNLSPGTEYDYHIIAFNIAGYSDFAGVSTASLTQAPAGVVVTAVANTAVTLAWNPVAYVGDAGEVTYNVYRGTSSDAISPVPVAVGLTAAGFTDTNLASGQVYYYQVTAIDPGGESAASAKVTATTGIIRVLGESISQDSVSALAIVVGFSSRCYPSIQLSSMTITSTMGGTGSPLHPVSVTEAGGNVVSFNFAATLPSGIYHAVLSAAGIVDDNQRIMPADVTFDFLLVRAGGTLTLGGSASSQTVQQISVADGGRLNLADKALVVQYAASSPAGVIAALIGSAFDGGRWDGPGIFSAVAAADPAYAHAVGYIDDGDQVSVRETWYGDVNLDQIVNADDVSLMVLGMISGRTGWSDGNFNYDAKVSADDWGLFNLGLAYGRNNAPVGTGKNIAGGIVSILDDRVGSLLD